MNSSKNERFNALFRKYITDAREQLNLTQTNLALKLGVPQGYISKIEVGLRSVDLAECVEILEAMGVKPADFISSMIDDFHQQEEFHKSNLAKRETVDKFEEFIGLVKSSDGPKTSDYQTFFNWIKKIFNEYHSKKLTYDDIQSLRGIFGEILTIQTLFGLALIKPHGYEHDFELIDKIYTNYITSDIRFRRWDEYFQKSETAKALRNRKNYFVNLLIKVAKKKPDANVLNIGSGSGRDMFEFFSDQKNSDIKIDCIEPQQIEIDYASELCKNFLENISFHRSNAFRFKPRQKYDVIWCGNLLDKYSNKRLQPVIRKMLSSLAQGGEIVVSSFTERDPDRYQMEILCNWFFERRSEQKLTELLNGSGARDYDLQKLGSNLLVLHIQ